MQVPLIDRLNDLQAGLNSLQNPSFSSQITSSSLAGIQSVSVAFNLCKWGAFILALVATFGSIINRITIFIIRFRKEAPSLPSISFLSDDDYDFSSSNDDDDDDEDQSSSSEFEDDERNSSSSSTFHRVNEYFRVRGSSPHIDDECQSQNENMGLKRRRSISDIFSLSEIANRKSVVKLWDSIGFGLGLDFDDSEEGVFSCYDIGREPLVPVVSTVSPGMVLSAGEGACGNLAVKVWDTRLRRRKPSVVAEWGPTVGNAVRVESGGVQKVYVRDDGRYGVTVGDMRNVSTPLGNVTESNVDTWWDEDAVVVSDESFGEDQSMLQTT